MIWRINIKSIIHGHRLSLPAWIRTLDNSIYIPIADNNWFAKKKERNDMMQNAVISLE